MIDLKTDGALWKVTLDRADKANALTRGMLQELVRVMDEARSKARVVVLTGRGKVFSAGMDLAQAETGLATDPVWEDLSGAIARLPCLTIAALNGTVAGGAMGMVLACDLRIATGKSRVFYPVAKLGFLPQPSDPKRLTALVGPARAKLILMAGAKLTAPEALGIGLIDKIIDPDTPGAMDDEIAALSQDALAAEPKHIAAIKTMVDG